MVLDAVPDQAGARARQVGTFSRIRPDAPEPSLSRIRTGRWGAASLIRPVTEPDETGRGAGSGSGFSCIRLIGQEAQADQAGSSVIRMAPA